MWPEFPSVAFFSPAGLISLSWVQSRRTNKLGISHSDSAFLSVFCLLFIIFTFSITPPPTLSLFFSSASIFHFCFRLPSSPSHSLVSPFCPLFLSNYGLPQQNTGADLARQRSRANGGPNLLPDVQSALIIASCAVSLGLPAHHQFTPSSPNLWKWMQHIREHLILQPTWCSCVCAWPHIKQNNL